MSILGFDGEVTEGSEGGGVFLKNGGGVSIKTFLTKRLTISSALSLKHFFVWGESTFEKGAYLCYTVGFSVGYVL